MTLSVNKNSPLVNLPLGWRSSALLAFPLHAYQFLQVAATDPCSRRFFLVIFRSHLFSFLLARRSIAWSVHSLSPFLFFFSSFPPVTVGLSIYYIDLIFSGAAGGGLFKQSNPGVRTDEMCLGPWLCGILR